MNNHNFNKGEGMTTTNSTPQERKEIYELLHSEGFRVYEKPCNYELKQYAKWALRFDGLDFILSSDDRITTPKTYSEMKELIAEGFLETVNQ